MALFNPLMVGVEGIGTPEELDRLRAELAARQPQYGKASNIGEGIGQLLTGIGSGIQNYRLGKAKKAGDASAATDRSAAYTEINKLLTGGVNSSFASPSQPSASQAPSVPQKPMAISGGRQDFVSALLPAAMEESKRTGVDPRIIIAQGALESGWGKSAPGNNLFGIKSHGQGGGNTLATTEYVNGKPVTIRDSFRAYENPAQSVRGYGDFILQNPRYKPLREAQGLDAQLSALQASGYATDPKYGEKIGAIARGIQLPNETSSADPQQAFNAVLGQQQAAPQPQQTGDGFDGRYLIYDDKGMRMEMPKRNSYPPKNPYSGPGAQVDVPMLYYDDKGMRMETSSSLRKLRDEQKAPPAQGYVDPMVKVVPPTPAPQPTQPQQVAQAAPQDRGMMEAIGGGQGQGANYFPPAPGQQKAGGIDLPTLMKAAQNPWLDSGTRQFVNGLIQQEMQKQSPEYQMQQQKQQLEMQKLQKEISAPAERKTVVVNGRLVDATTGQLVAEYPDQVKPTDDMREYEYAKTQGFQGSFVDFQLAQKKAGATSITTNVGEGDKFYENLDKKNAETFAAMSDAGIQARAKMAQIDRLQGLMENAPQGWQGALKQAAGEWGIATEGLSDIQAATALIEKMVPEQRQPGSGQMSDADIKMFRASLPRIINQPGGNQLVFDTIRGIAQYETQMGEIADKVADRVISPAEGRRMIREMKNPLENFKVPKGEATPNEGRKTATGATWSIDQ